MCDKPFSEETEAFRYWNGFWDLNLYHLSAVEDGAIENELPCQMPSDGCVTFLPLSSEGRAGGSTRSVLWAYYNPVNV